MNTSIKRNIAKVAIMGALAWASFRIIKGISKKESASVIIEKTVAPIEDTVKEVKKISKKFIKGSPEAKEYMAKLREKGKGIKRGEGKKMLKISSKKNIEYEIADVGAGGKEYNIKQSEGYKKAMEKKSGFPEHDKLLKKLEKSKSSKKHKGHKSKKGLSLDQKKKSSEKHEKQYRKNKVKKGA